MNLFRKEMWKCCTCEFLKEEQCLERQRLHSGNKNSFSEQREDSCREKGQPKPWLSTVGQTLLLESFSCCTESGSGHAR